MIYLAWAILLVVQNASFTWVSRARNSRSLGYHAIAAVFSNGVWFVSQFTLVTIVVRDIDSVATGLLAAAVYIGATVAGSVGSHWFLMHFVESGKRKVG